MKIWQLATLIGLACITAFAQPSTPPKYILIDYMKVEPGKGQQYIKMEQDLWKTVHKTQIENKNIESWAVYSVRYPSGTQADSKRCVLHNGTYRIAIVMEVSGNAVYEGRARERRGVRKRRQGIVEANP